jgi:hypothetical protein
MERVFHVYFLNLIGLYIRSNVIETLVKFHYKYVLQSLLKKTRNGRFGVWVWKPGKPSIIFGLETGIFKPAFCFQLSIQNFRFGSV